MGLAAALLPPFPDAAAAMLAEVPPSPAAAIEAAGGAQAEPQPQGQAAAAAGGADEAGQREQFLRDHPELLQKLTADLLPLMIKVGG